MSRGCASNDPSIAGHGGYQTGRRRDQLLQSRKMERGKKRHTLRALFIIFLASCSFLAPILFFRSPSSAILPICSYLAADSERGGKEDSGNTATSLTTTTVPKSSISCDRAGYSSDFCELRGNVRITPSSSSVYLDAEGGIPTGESAAAQVEKIRPYPRKWDKKLMESIKEIKIVVNSSGAGVPSCDVLYPVPAVVFSIGGFTGNVYHAFNDALIPLFITSQRYQRRVVFLVLEYQPWWMNKYKEIFSRLSAYPPIDFFQDNLTRCFPEVTVGLQAHGDLSIDPSPKQTIHDFRRMLDDAYRPVVRPLEHEENGLTNPERPKVLIIFREGTRAVENEDELVKLCEKVGFRVQVLRPKVIMEIAEIYEAVNSSDAMIGVVGAAMTHLLFQKPGDVFIQIVLLGTKWAAETSYGVPAKKMGLKYIPYRIKPWESSLSRVYGKNDPVITDPDSINKKGWDEAAKVYLQQQAVRVDLKRFAKFLKPAYDYIVERKKAQAQSNSN